MAEIRAEAKYSPNTIDRVDQARYFDVTDGYSADIETGPLPSQRKELLGAALAYEKNIQTDLPIWRFELPAAVGSQLGTQE